MKKDNVMNVINGYAGSYRYVIVLGRVLAAMSALVGMIPYYDLWKIIKIAISGENLSGISPLAWQAVGIMILSMVMYVGALMCTHVSAFRVQANLRSRLMKHIVTLPLGVFDQEGTGKIRRIVNESSAATETYIAHNLADKAVAAATPVGLVVLMLAFDWKIGLICLIPAVIGFIFMSGMMGREMQEKMGEYQNALEVMSSEATEYVRGIPVVKTFGQTVFSFKRFKRALDDYEKWCVSYTISLRKSMMGFMTGINAIFVALVFAGFFFSRGGVTPDLILNMMYYIIITPLLTVTLTKIAYAGEQEMQVVDAMKRINDILDMKPLAEAENGKKPRDFSVEVKQISYRYPDAQKDAIHDLSLSIPSCFCRTKRWRKDNNSSSDCTVL